MIFSFVLVVSREPGGGGKMVNDVIKILLGCQSKSRDNSTSGRSSRTTVGQQGGTS